jgi:hypothetical protein
MIMAEHEELFNCFETLRNETLPELGVNDRRWRQIIAARLIIERIGEQDNNYWWDSQVLSSFGADTLDEAVPQTSVRTQIALATKIGKTVESNSIGSDSAISLFDLGPSIETQIQRIVNSAENEKPLSVLEPLSVEVTESGWSDSLTDADALTDSGVGITYELGNISIEDLQDEAVLNEVVSQLIAGYGAATKHELVVPYYTVES